MYFMSTEQQYWLRILDFLMFFIYSALIKGPGINLSQYAREKKTINKEAEN